MPKSTHTKGLSRRGFLAGVAATAATAAGGSVLLAPRAHANVLGIDPSRRRFLNIFLNGAWDSALATDPLVGSKAASAAYDPAYANWLPTTVTGKSLQVGAGLTTAIPALAALPTAFINGMTVEVTAHDIAKDYLLSGVLALSRNRTYPAMAALMGSQTATYPPHVNLGFQIPLGDTAEMNPPLQAANMFSLGLMLSGINGYEEVSPSPATGDAINAFVHKRNQQLLSRRGQSARPVMNPWIAADQGLPALYDARYDLQVAVDATMRARYGVALPGQQLELIPGAFRILESGLSTHVTVAYGNLDTHTNHFPQHVNDLRAFGTALSALVEDLQATPDPEHPDMAMADTTTIVISSEFVRTPMLNIASGTDHWQSASAIIMGPNVVDGAVIGATGDDAHPVDDTLRPEHLVATIVANMGYEAQADTIAKERLDGLFNA